MVTIVIEEWDNRKVTEDFKKPEFCPQGEVEHRATWRNPCRWEVAEYDDKMRMNRKEDGRDYYIYQYQGPNTEIHGDEEFIRFEDLEGFDDEEEYEVLCNGVNAGVLIESMCDTIERIINAYRHGDSLDLKAEIDMAEDFITNHFGEEE